MAVSPRFRELYVPVFHIGVSKVWTSQFLLVCTVHPKHALCMCEQNCRLVLPEAKFCVLGRLWNSQLQICACPALVMRMLQLETVNVRNR